jgi:hypothetical protein
MSNSSLIAHFEKKSDTNEDVTADSLNLSKMIHILEKKTN